MIKTFCTRAAWLIAGVALPLAAMTSAASAETLLMPDRQTRTGVQVVVWGVTDLAVGTGYAFDFESDGTNDVSGSVTDGSYISTTHTYAAPGTYTVTFTVGAEVATTEVSVFDPAALPGGAAGAPNRDLGINMAIEDGLRWLYVNQRNRAANFPGSPTTEWGPTAYPGTEVALAVAAFQNQGYLLDPDPTVAPTGIYEKYVVQRAINYTIQGLRTQTLTTTPNGDDPCQGAAAAAEFAAGGSCTGLFESRDRFPGYSNGVGIIALAASGALNRVVDAGDVPGNSSGNFVVGKTYGEILQRMANTSAWGQGDVSNGRGGWAYRFNEVRGDGSTLGWELLGLLDAAAAGVIVPQWVRDEVAIQLNLALNNDGTLDYTTDGNPASDNAVGPEKNGIGHQGLFFINETSGARVDAVTAVVDDWWDGIGTIGGNVWRCNSPGSVNKGCAYTMYNNFKGLGLQGIATLPSVGRPAGPGAIPANDWRADYEDWFVANQDNPTDAFGGSWGPVMTFSRIHRSDVKETAIAELILSGVTLVLPDPVLFATLGLQHGAWVPEDNDPPPSFEAENTTGDNHLMTARALSTTGTPVPGAVVDFSVLTGPNMGAAICPSDTTDANGEATCTYTSAGTGIDTIQANIGVILSNVVRKTWIPPNRPPEAVCQNVTRECLLDAQTSDVTPASFDGGSTDPDGDTPLLFLVDPALPYALSPPANSTVELTVRDRPLSDPLGLSDVCNALFTVEDTTPPAITAELRRISGRGDEEDDDDEGLYEVIYGVEDSCDPDPVVTSAVLRNPDCRSDIPVVNGEIFEFETEDEGDCEVEIEDGRKEIEASGLDLVVTATDADGNVSTVVVALVIPGGDNDEEWEDDD